MNHIHLCQTTQSKNSREKRDVLIKNRENSDCRLRQPAVSREMGEAEDPNTELIYHRAKKTKQKNFCYSVMKVITARHCYVYCGSIRNDSTGTHSL